MGISQDRESWEGRWFEHCADPVVGMCLCGWQFGEGKKKIDYVTCKDQLPSDGQVPHHLTLMCH